MVYKVENLDLVPYPHPALRYKTKPIPQITPLVQDVAHKMIKLMYEYNGVGLAANQIGIPWQMFVTCVNEKELVFINPQVIQGKNKRASTIRLQGEHESCLSLRGLHLEEKVFRSREVYVEAQDINGKSFVISGPGLLARVIQHEFDHLQGILFFDRLKLDGLLQIGEETITMKEYLDKWLNYFSVQYEYATPPISQVFGTLEEENQKLAYWESVLLEKAA